MDERYCVLGKPHLERAHQRSRGIFDEVSDMCNIVHMNDERS
ncbi:hypothetical protein BSU04_40665 [Caballeronia sordidicola]|uniref:Uncharacterized protein n=1 Tax=Caballeronia sordidicola TaxID=196367 RepID=A0A226WN88_CABSO|nr:hypothetical protein BSU04_40665 [Caballeronia sordidicola]